MRKKRGSPRPGRVLLACLLGLALPALAENMDPDDDGSQYAYAENIGWLNAQPLGPGGPGAQVDDFELTGWIWSENAGWISLSCKNTQSCGSHVYGVINDGQGILSGFAWGENVGWINFAPFTGPVTIDTSTGVFAGRAWGENVGWITLGSAGPSPFVVRTAWSCDPAPPAPADAPSVELSRPGEEVELSWNTVAGATGFDVVSGDLDDLRATGGDFGVSTQQCLANNRTESSLDLPDDPAAGAGIWYLVAAANCGGSGGFDSGEASQVASRAAGIASSGNDCP